MSAPILLVTGGAGYIGSHVCKAAAAAGYLPVTFDNLQHGHESAVRWGPLEQGDLRDRGAVRAVLAKWRPQSVIHLAALISVGESVQNPDAYYETNVTATLGLLKEMRAAGILALAFSSSAAVYGEPERTPIDEAHSRQPLSPYGASKLMVEQTLIEHSQDHGLRSISLRYFNAAGADRDGEIGEAHKVETHLIPLAFEALAGARPPLTIHGDDYPTRDGTCLRDYVHVEDLAQAHLLALESLATRDGARAYNLGSGAGATVREVVDAVGRVAGREVPVRIGSRREGDAPALLADATLAKRELGWTPRHSDLATIISSAWAWHGRQRQPREAR